MPKPKKTKTEPKTEPRLSNRRRYYVLTREDNGGDWALDPAISAGLDGAEAEQYAENWLATEPEGRVLVVYGTTATVEVEHVKLHIKP